MIRTLSHKTLTFRGSSWMFRIGPTTRQTIVDPPVYTDSHIQIRTHHSVSGSLVGYEVLLRYLPDVPMVYDEHAVIVIFHPRVPNQVNALFADNNFRVLGCGDREMNYLIVPKYGTVDITNSSMVRDINSIIQGVKRG